MRISDWSSDVCSSDLPDRRRALRALSALQCLRLGRKGAAFGGDRNQLVGRDDGIHPCPAGQLRRPGATCPLYLCGAVGASPGGRRSEEHTSELQSLMRNSYAVLCLKQKKK